MFRPIRHIKPLMGFILISMQSICILCTQQKGFISGQISSSDSNQLPPASSIGRVLPQLDLPQQQTSLIEHQMKPTITSHETPTKIPDSHRITAESSSDEDESIAGPTNELLESNYLSTDSAVELSVTSTDTSTTQDDNSLLGSVSGTQRSSSKTRRHAESLISAADWWTKISNKKEPTKTQTGNTKQVEKNQRKSSSTGQSVKKTNVYREPAKATVYKEQPINQNPILTTRNQLKAIRAKHKLLVTKSIRDLQQLDQKLINSYKLCMKKQMPLYAGMLYRTRDFVVKMAKEVKHERKVLEAMSKQVEGVLRQKMSNRTMVREFNRLMNLAKDVQLWSLNGAQQSIDQVQKVEVTTKVITTRARKDVGQSVELEQVAQTNIGQAKKSRNESGRNSNGKKGEATTIIPSETTTRPVDSGFKSRKTSQERETNNPTTKKPSKPVRYTVHVNEVNLKKELNKSQALIDRINKSCHELSEVMDDIIHLFKLSPENSGNKKGASWASRMSKLDKMYMQQQMSSLNMSAADRKLQGKKMFKSPVRVFLEKYGKLANLEAAPNSSLDATTTSESSNNTTTTTVAPDVKPLFDSSSLIYSEPTDLELGFDYMSLDE